MRYDSILGTIGNTPSVRINNIDTHGTNLFVKIEAFNPMGSVKDRLALGVIEDAEARGELKPGQTVVEATSGNTGIGLAMVCAQKGYPLVVTMAENFSVERRKLMRFLGARVVLTPAHEKGSGMVAKAAELAKAHGWWQSRQFENPANAAIHERTTAVEILRDFEDLSLDYWVTGFGTAGTLNGVSRVLKVKSPHTKIMVCEPDNAPILASGLAQPHNASHPSFRPHLMQGWSPDFIPQLAQQVLDGARIDHYLPIDGNEALQCCADLAQKEGIFVGISAGATFAGALAVARDAPAGSTILCMLPDTGERYLSTPLFAEVPEQMTEEEMAISRSTPGYRFDASHAAPPPTQDAPQPLDEAAVEEVSALLSDAQHPVVMFALEWCEFCWSVRKVFKQYGIEYRSVDLDSVAYQSDNRGGKIRAVLKDKTGWNTLPQIFIQGEFIGGCTDLFDQIRDGSLAERLKQGGIPFDQTVDADPYKQLPSWLHPR
ncbi:pyridoxal-phosphate dependent enzyme [Ferrimonas balearica]|uniref:pyridoxal-phosphate dependent enzyme n=1 Tax=Ferrimonas balearica TaxID=44012 RepID=UPI001C996D26|nr:pyridoxal-phosphate dependent enzyme [Ferrimonas balearica]MBY5921622.1 pyridoxal-phosphate dependent enzyme [Ferrimonas balearica]MBY5995038.1 pyridoxal-phosphate dependent enzyme [Ferrimonas balearica]